MQRRKIEISKRLQKTSNTANNLNNLGNPQTSKNLQKEIEQLKLTSTNSSNKSSFKSAKFDKQNSVKGKSPQVEKPPGDEPDAIMSDEDVWLHDLSARVCSEFVKMQNETKKVDMDANLSAALVNPTYKNFNMISDFFKTNPLGNDSTDAGRNAEITQLVLDYLRTHDITHKQGDEDTFEQDLLKSILDKHLDKTRSLKGDTDKPASSLPSMHTQKSLRIKHGTDYNRVYYRWDPRWLRTFRKRLCIPVAIITLLFLLFTNVNSNWIYVDGEFGGNFSLFKIQ